MLRAPPRSARHHDSSLAPPSPCRRRLSSAALRGPLTFDSCIEPAFGAFSAAAALRIISATPEAAEPSQRVDRGARDSVARVRVTCGVNRARRRSFARESELGGPTETFLRLRSLSRTNSFGDPRVRAVVGLRPPLLDGHMRQGLAHVPVQVRSESGKALKNGRVPGANSR